MEAQKGGWAKALRGLLYAVVLLGGLWIGYGLVRYGTATPCGMLAEEMKSRIAMRATQPLGSGQERALETLAARIAAGFAAERARSQGPLKCAQSLWRIKVKNGTRKLYEGTFIAVCRPRLSSTR